MAATTLPTGHPPLIETTTKWRHFQRIIPMAHDIARVFNAEKGVLSLMPHPEDLIRSPMAVDQPQLFSGLCG
jgi:hypothetical protein